MASGAGQRTFGLRRILIALFFSFYRFLVFPALRSLGGLGHECRFHPTCSRYSEEAFSRFSFLKAARLSVLRLLRCHPWSHAPSFDPVPEMNR